MTLDIGTIAALIHYGLLVLFGVTLSAAFLRIEWTGKNTAALLAFSVALLGVQLVLFLSLDAQAVEKLYPLITHLPLALFLVLWFRQAPGRAVLSITIAYLCCQIVHWLELVVSSLTHSQAATDLAASLLLILLAAVILRYFAPPISKLMLAGTPERSVYSIIPLAYYLYDYATTVYTDVIRIPQNISMEFMPFLVSLTYLVFSTVIHRQQEAYFEAKQKAGILSMQLKQYEAMQERIDETRRARHDLRQHLRLISAYIENGDSAALAEYVKSYSQRLPEDLEVRFCENAVVDTIVKYYAIKSREHGIGFEVSLQIPEKLNIAEPDLCVLLGNLLENALEACRRQEGKNCKIKLSGRLQGSRTLVITLDNSPSEPPKTENGILLSSKHGPREGLGTKSIKNIAAQYGGNADFEWKQGVFYASVILLLPLQ